MDEKSRFGELSTEAILTRNYGQCRPSKNKKSHKVRDEIIER